MSTRIGPEEVADDGREWGLGREDMGRVIITSGKYLSKHKGNTRVLDPITFIAELTQHIPDAGKPPVRIRAGGAGRPASLPRLS